MSTRTTNQTVVLQKVLNFFEQEVANGGVTDAHVDAFDAFINALQGGLAPFVPAGYGPGYTESNVIPAPAPAPTSPVVEAQPFRTDLPPGLNVKQFATQETAITLATKFGGTVYLEPGNNPGSGVPALYISFPNSKPWNAGDLYEELQQHPDYNPNPKPVN